jgi:hypothetical protein
MPLKLGVDFTREETHLIKLHCSFRAFSITISQHLANTMNNVFP